jgi:hypothetical protein
MEGFDMKAKLLGLIALLVLFGAMPSHASTIINGTFSGNATLTPTGTPGDFVQNFTGSGNDTIFGSFTSASTSTIDFSSPPNILISGGSFTETFGAGKLFGTSSGSGTASGTGTATLTLDFVFTGGTGLFAGATGNAKATGTITQTSPTTESITNGSYTGTLEVVTPLPAALPLFATGLGALGLLGWRRKRKAAAALAA